MPIKPIQKESPKEIVKKLNTAPSKPQSSIYDAKRLGATIAPATYYHTKSQLPASKPYNPVPPPISGKHIFYPTSNKPPTASVIAPPLTPQMPKNTYGNPPPLSRPSMVSPVIRNTWEDQKEVSTGRTSTISPIPPPAPTVVAPSSASASVIKHSPPTIRGQILDQANFGIRAFKQDVSLNIKSIGRR